MAPKLCIIIGSTRPGRIGPTVGKWVHKIAEKNEAFDVELVDLAEFKLPLLDESSHPSQKAYEKDHTKRWSAAVESADSFIFVTPEYDYFPPASLVNALQCLSREWKYKAAGVVCYGGVSGGLRSAQELRLLISNLGMVALPETVPVQFVANHVEDGKLNANDKMEKGASGLVAELAKWSSALMTLRQ